MITTQMTGSKIRRIHPKKFALWMALISMVMFFSAFTSAYIVRKAAGNWLSFPIPEEFYVSTGAILASSVILHIAYKSFIDKNYVIYKLLLSMGFVLGVVFVALQYLGWLKLNEMGVFIHTNQSSSFTGLIVGAHALHVIGGITALLVCWIYAIRPSTSTWSEKRQLRLELTFTFWHFVDILWIYLLVFFWVQQ